MTHSANPLTSITDNAASRIADSGQGLLNATGAAAGAAWRTVNQASRSSIDALTDRAGHLAHDSAQAARHRAVQLRDSGSEYIRERPIQATLIAAGIGAMLVLLAGSLMRVGRSR